MTLHRRSNVDYHQNQIENPVLHFLASAPGSPVEGQLYYDSTTHVVGFYNGTAWILVGRLDQISAPTADVPFGSHKITSLADPTSAQDAATKNYIDTRHIGDLTAPNADFSMNTHKVTSVLDPTGAQDAATKSYVDSQIAGARDVKDSVRVATAAALPAYTRTGNVITATGNGALAAVDAVTLVANDRLLVKDGAAAADNGIYTVTQVGTGGTPYILTRASDADASAEVTAGLYTWVEEGTTNADTGWLLTTDNPITLNTTGLTFTQVSALGQITAGTGASKSGSTINVGAGATPGTGGPGGGLVANADDLVIDKAVVARGFAASVGNASATSIDVAHNLNTRDVLVQCYDNTTPFAEQEVEVRHKDANTVTLVFSVAPSSNQFRCVVLSIGG